MEINTLPSQSGFNFDLASKIFSPGKLVQEVAGEAGGGVGLAGAGFGFQGGKYGEMGAEGDLNSFYDPKLFFNPDDFYSESAHFDPQGMLDGIINDLI